MPQKYELYSRSILEKLNIKDPHFVEIEGKKRVLPEEAADIKNWLIERKGVRYRKSMFFFDQYIDTPKYDLLKAGASLRLRYKRNGSAVYLQYKGPGFTRDELLYRSEFSSGKLTKIFLEESHHDIVHFKNTEIEQILRKQASSKMFAAMRAHLGAKTVKNLNHAPIIALYQKEKFDVDLGSAYLEPSIDRIFAFHIEKKGLHPLSTFCEFENEIKAEDGSLETKLQHIDALLEFNARMQKEFELKREPLDKYHRCASFFLKRKR